MLRRWKPVESIDALGGEGVIAGEMSGDPAVPDGLLTVNGVPTSREIEVRDRKTRRVVSVRRSNADGTYRFPGLNPALQYDVIARDFAGDYEDVIAGAVRPHTPDLLVPVAAGDKMAAFSDPFGGDVVSLLNFQGADGSTTITDETGKPWTAVGNAQIDTSLGYNACQFDGSGDHIEMPHSNDLIIGAQDFCIEGIARVSNVTSQQTLIEKRSSGWSAGDWVVFIYAGRVITYSYDNDPYAASALLDSGAGSLAANTEFHWAWTRSGTMARLFLDGVQKASVLMPSAITNNSQPLKIGVDSTGGGRFWLNGHVRASRVTIGAARYAANFIPPTAPFGL